MSVQIASMLNEPMAAWAVCGAFLIVCFAILGYGPRLWAAYGGLLAAVLAGYAFLGKGFAYVGLAPVFIGELALAAGLLALVLAGGLGRAFRSSGTWLIGLLGLWGLWRTIPYLGVHGIDAFRDAVLFGYGAFAILVFVRVKDPLIVRRVLRGFSALAPLYLIWLPLAAVLMVAFSDALPEIAPGVTIPYLKFGDLAVHLAGVGAFFGLGLAPSGSFLARRIWLSSGLLAMGSGLIASQSRGGLLSVLVAFAVVMAARPANRLWRILPVACAGIALALAIGVGMDSGRKDRMLSLGQAVTNVESLIGVRHASGGNLSGTANWRLQWWEKIVDYTVFGPYFWQGRGFGANLASIDGFVVDVDESLRSPHNGHLSFLARAGVPGLVLWLGLIGWLGFSLLKRSIALRAVGEDAWSRVFIFVLAYGCAFLVNASFDVFLEGPQGGIFFWSLVGFAMSLLFLIHPAPSVRRTHGDVAQAAFRGKVGAVRVS